jgi:PAS domain S-box-containing protein
VESEERFRMLFETSPIGIVLLGEDLRWFHANDSFLKIVGYGSEELSERTVIDITPPAWREEDERQLRILHATGVCGPFEKEYIHKDGHIVPVRVTGMLVPDTGTQWRIWAMVEDITAQKRAELERSCMQRLAHAVTGQLTLGDISRALSREARGLFVYDAYSFDLYSVATNTLKGVHIEDTPSGCDSPVAMDPSAGDTILVRSPEILAGRPLLVNRSGNDGIPERPAIGDKSRRSMSIMYAPLSWQGNLFALASVHSYTEGRYGPRDLDLFESLASQCSAAVARVLAEEDLRGKRDELERVQMQYSAILRATPDGLAILGRDWTIRYANHAMHAILDPAQSPGTELIGMPMRVLFPAEAEFQEYRRSVMRSAGAEASVTELRLRRLTGEDFWCALSAVRMDPSQTASGFVVTMHDVTGRHIAEQARQDAESRFRGLVEQSLVGIFIQHDGVIVYANQRASEMLGRSVDELRALPDPLAVVHPDDVEGVRYQLAGLVYGERRTAVVSGRAVRPDGRVVQTTLHATKIDIEGTAAIIAMLMDATELWQAERENKMVAHLASQLTSVRTREQVAEVMRQTTESIWNWDSFGVSVRNIHGSDFTRILVVDTVEGVRRQFPPFAHSARKTMPGWKDLESGLATLVSDSETTGTGRGRNWENPDGRSRSMVYAPMMVGGVMLGYVTMQSRTAGFFNEDDRNLLQRLAQAMGPAMERCRAEAETRRYAAAMEQASDAVIIADTDWIVQHVNMAFERITGYAREDVLGRDARRLPEIVHQAESYQRAMDAVLQRGDPWTGRLTCRRADGTEYEEELTASPIRTAGGRVSNYVIVRRDVTRELLLEAQLRQSQKMEAFGMLAGGVAHDFNNLLQLMLSYSKVLMMRKPPDDPDRAELDGIVRAARRGANLTSQLLAFSRKQVLQPRLLNLADTVRATAAMVERLIGESIRVEMRTDPDTGLVYADPGQLEQVIINLAVNARDAMPGGGTLTLETKPMCTDRPPPWAPANLRSGVYACLIVTDTGTGMDRRTMDRIFEPFFTTKGVGQGTGLGLSMVYGIVAQSSGHISVRSQPGAGTCFTICFPQVTGRDSADDIAQEGGEDEGGTETLILVEDEAEVRQLAASFLRGLGYQVLEARNGRDALRIVDSRDGEVHLLITDVVMPEIGGIALAEQARKRCAGLRVLFMSGYTDDPGLATEMRDHSAGFLQKPVAPDQLARRVREMLAAPSGR